MRIDTPSFRELPMTDRLEPADPLCFSHAATVVLAKPPNGKVKITSKSLPEEKVLQRDQILEVRFLDGQSGSPRRPAFRMPAIDRSQPMIRTGPAGPRLTDVTGA